jgi:hypothetical protein
VPLLSADELLAIAVASDSSPLPAPQMIQNPSDETRGQSGLTETEARVLLAHGDVNPTSAGSRTEICLDVHQAPDSHR